MVIDDIFSFAFGSIEPGKPNREVDNNQSYSQQQDNYVLDDGTNVAAESHVATLLGTVKISSIVVIRCLQLERNYIPSSNLLFCGYEVIMMKPMV